MSNGTKLTVLGLALILSGCATTKFISTWKDPTAAPLSKAKGQIIIACVATGDEYSRHDGEDALAAELTKRGAKGVPSYTLLPPGLMDEGLAKAAFEKSGATAVVVMRPLAAEAGSLGDCHGLYGTLLWRILGRLLGLWLGPSLRGHDGPDGYRHHCRNPLLLPGTEQAGLVGPEQDDEPFQGGVVRQGTGRRRGLGDEQGQSLPVIGGASEN